MSDLGPAYNDRVGWQKDKAGLNRTVAALLGRGIDSASAESLTVLNISDSLDRGMLHAILKPGDFVFLQGAISFQSQTTSREGVGQLVRGTRKANGVIASFVFDRWEATATSAWGMWLRGRQEASSLLRVMSIVDGEDLLRLEVSVIAIGAALEGLKNREYSNLPFRREVYVPDANGAA